MIPTQTSAHYNNLPLERKQIMTVYGSNRKYSTSSDLLMSPDGSTICLLNSHHNTDYREYQDTLSLQYSKMSDVTRVMSRTNSGLDVKDRIWLKLRIPDAFTGTNLVTWLYRNVHGFSDRREARKYAAGLLKGGFIVSAVNNCTFSEQRYYHLSPIWVERTQPQKELRLLNAPTTQYSNPCFGTSPVAHLTRQSSSASSTTSTKSRSKTWQAVRNNLIRRSTLLLGSFQSNAV